MSSGQFFPFPLLLQSLAIDIATAGDHDIVPAVAGQTVRIHKLFCVSAGVNVTPKDGSGGTAFTGPMNLGGLALDVDVEPYFMTSPGHAFTLGLDANVQLSGRVYYQQS